MVTNLVPRRSLLKSSVQAGHNTVPRVFVRFCAGWLEGNEDAGYEGENVEGLVSSPEPLGLISKGVSRARDQKKRLPNYKSIYDFRSPKTTTDYYKQFCPFKNII